MIIITLACASWQQWASQTHMLQVLWRIQIFCIRGLPLPTMLDFFYKQQNYAVKFLWILKFIKFVWLLCIWGPGSPTDSVSVFISDRFIQLNLYEYLSLLYYLGLCKLATMSPLGWHPPCVVDNTDTLYLGTSIAKRQCWFSL